MKYLMDSKFLKKDDVAFCQKKNQADYAVDPFLLFNNINQGMVCIGMYFVFNYLSSLVW